VLRGTAAEVAGEISSQVRAKLLKLGEMLQRELLRTATLLRSADMPSSEDFQVLAEMPAFPYDRQDGLAKRPISRRLGRWVPNSVAKHRLEAYEDIIKLALESLFPVALCMGPGRQHRFGASVRWFFANRYRAPVGAIAAGQKAPTTDAARVKIRS